MRKYEAPVFDEVIYTEDVLASSNNQEVEFEDFMNGIDSIDDIF